MDCRLETGIGLWPWGVVSILIPSLALFVQNIYVVLFQPSLVIAKSLQKGHPQTSRDVPCDVAVHAGNNESAPVFLATNSTLRANLQPCAGVVRLEREKHPPSGRKHSHVTSHGVASVQHGSVKRVVGLRRRGCFGRATDNEEVVSLDKACQKSWNQNAVWDSTYVEMNRVWKTESSFRIILDEPVNPLADTLASIQTQSRLEVMCQLTWSTASTPQMLFVSG